MRKNYVKFCEYEFIKLTFGISYFLKLELKLKRNSEIYYILDI